MPLLTLPQQSSFIPGRSITDNIIVAQEIIHTLRLKTGKLGWMTVKVDLEKAFDRLKWDYIHETLHGARLPLWMINVIMKCVTAPSMQVIWNGAPLPPFTPGRGIRQGDPLSPYIYVLCMERLSQSINQAVSEKQWRPLIIRKGGPPLTYLFFADDLLLVCSTEPAQISLVHRLLGDFCQASGHKISPTKSRVFFSRNTDDHTATRISTYLGFQQTNNLGKYLGVPLLHGRFIADTYQYLIEKVRKKLNG